MVQNITNYNAAPNMQTIDSQREQVFTPRAGIPNFQEQGKIVLKKAQIRLKTKQALDYSTPVLDDSVTPLSPKGEQLMNS